MALITHGLSTLTDLELQGLLQNARPLHTGIDGRSVELVFAGTRYFVKKIPLSALEMTPENQGRTANLFGLPSFCHYGLGVPGFGSWRELAATLQARDWLSETDDRYFLKLLHHRVLPAPAQPALDLAQIQEREAQIQNWGGSAPVRARYEALARTTHEIVMVFDFIPRTLKDWMVGEAARGADAFTQAILFAESNLRAAVDVLKAHGMLHFDTHFENILTDGHGFYLTDFGLAISKDFELEPEEARFLELHADYDLARASIGLVHAVITALEPTGHWADHLHAFLKQEPDHWPPAAREAVRRYAPLAVVQRDFARRLMTDKLTPYPHDEISNLVKRL
ncbi:MAG: hypothetical protein KF681_02520 [Bdellovibrionaceae bacterium]|nr:hypothetical protein [Pseudobdellovibrionaceae bacterium]